MKSVHLLLAVQSVVAILVSINRLGTWTLGYVLPNEFLRWVDFNNMLVLPLISLVAFYLLKKTLEYDSPQREAASHRILNSKQSFEVLPGPSSFTTTVCTPGLTLRGARA